MANVHCNGNQVHEGTVLPLVNNVTIITQNAEEDINKGLHSLTDNCVALSKTINEKSSEVSVNCEENSSTEVVSNEIQCEIKTKMECDSEENNSKGSVGFPCYNFDNFIEITKSTKPFTLKKFLIGCKWSPDGTCLLTNCADYTVRLYDLPKQLYNKQSWNRNCNEICPELETSLKITEGGQIYDYEWYPFMSSWYPETCSFLTTSSKAPIHLWDAYHGKIIATYRGYNRVDETDNAYSIKFSLNGEKIYGGYRNEIKIFNTSYPGRDYINIDTKHVAGQTGIISCIAENPTVTNMFAVGSYKKTIGLYLDSGDSICLLNGQRCGITHMQWSPDGIYLYSGARKDYELLCWDIRNPGEILYTMDRIVNTNQRIYFDLTVDGKYLITGGTDGQIIVWDLKQTISNNTVKISYLTKFQSHIDCTNGVSIHKQLPILATTSGQHHFPDLTSDDDEDNIFNMEKMCTLIENCVKLWWIGPLSDEQSE